MKKHFISAALVLLLMLTISPIAHADVTYYPGPGDIEAGSELNHLIATVPTGSTVSSTGTMPDGISLQWSEKGDVADVYIRGSSKTAGTYNFIINVNGKNDLICTLHIVPSRPVLSISSSQSCLVGENVTLEVSAEVFDSGSLSYTWFKNSTKSTSGGSLLEGANGPAITPDTSVAGTVYYYCAVTNTNNGETSTSLSAVSSVTVKESGVDSIAVETLPERTVYKPGEELSTKDLSISVKYSDGKSEIISEGFSIIPVSLDTPGKYTVEVSYMGKSCSFEVSVEEDKELIEGIGILSLPHKTVYVIGDKLSAEGLSIRVYTNSGYRDVVTGFTCSPSVLDKAGKQEIIVSYGGKTCTYTVDVQEKEVPVGITVLTLPEKLSYTVGEELQTDGLSLKLIMNTGRFEELYSGFICSPITFDKPGTQDIKVSYGSLSCTFSVSVADKASEETPAVDPVPTDDPAPSASPEVPQPQEKPDKENKSGSALPVVIASVAVLSLCALGIYCYSINKAGKDNFFKKLRDFIDKIAKK